MNPDDLMLFLVFVTLLCAVLAFGAWWSDRTLRDLRRGELPDPRPDAVAGVSYRTSQYVTRDGRRAF